MDNEQEYELTQTKITEWKNEPTLSQLKENLSDSGGAYRENIENIEKWLDHLNIEGKAKRKPIKNRSNVQPKLIRKQAEWRYAALSEPFLSTPNLFEISPVSWEDRKAAYQNSLVLNNQFNNRINKVKFIDELVRAVVNEGTAILRTGWLFEEEERIIEKPTFIFRPINPNDQESIQMLQQAMDMLNTAPDSFSIAPENIKASINHYMETGEMVLAEQTGIEEVTEMVTTVNKPTIEVCDYKDIYVDPTCRGDIDKAQFVIHAIPTDMNTLKKDGRYTNLDRIDLDKLSTAYFEDTEREVDNFSFKDKPRKKFFMYEYWGFWDIDGNGITKPILASWVGDTLIRLEENPFPDKKLPFIFIPYLPKRNNLYGESDGSLLIDNQEIIGAISRGVIDLLGKSANAQRGVRRQYLDITNKNKFEQGLDYEFNADASPRESIIEHKFPEVPNSALNMIQFFNMDAEALTGVKSFSTGGGITGANLGDTAAGVRGALDAASKRELGILRRLSQGIIDVGRKVLSMNSEFLEEEEVVRISNEQFVKVRKDDLAGYFDLNLTISTAEADKAKSDQLSFMLQTLGSTLNTEMVNLILSEIARLNRMPELKHAIENFKPEPDPIQEKLRELEVAKLEAEVEFLRAQAMDKVSRGELNKAKIPSEIAKAENVQAKTDKEALDFAEQEAGIKHNREMDKAENKFRFNERLKNWNEKMKEMEQAGVNTGTNNEV